MAGGTLERKDFFKDDVIKGYEELESVINKTAKAQLELIKSVSKSKSEYEASNQSKEKTKKVVDELAKAEALAEKNRQIIAKSIKTISDAEKENLIIKEQARRATAELNKEIKKTVDAMEGGKKSTNTWSNALTSFQAKFNTIGNVLGGAVFAGIAAVGMAFKEAFNEVVKFNTKATELQTITGAGVIGMIQMTSAAVKMSLGFGESGIKINQSASDILEAFKLVASAKPELLGNAKALEQVTEQALILAKAAGTDAATAVTSLTGIMNQFNAPAKDAGRYVNVLAAGAKFGAGEIPFLAESITKFGVAAKTAKQPIEESAAVMELFAEKGLKAEQAGISYRNILIKSMADQKNYKDGVFSTSLMMENLGKIQNDTTLLTKKFGVENVLAAQILAQGRQRVDELTKSLTGTNTAYEQAENNTKTLSESWTYLKKGVEAITLGILGSAGPLKTFIDLLGKAAAAIGLAFNENVSTQLQKEQVNMNALAGATMSAAEGSKLRASLMSELQQKYPEYFGNLDKEKASLYDIKKALSEANSEYVKKIQLAVVGEDLAKVQKKYSDAFETERSLLIQINELYVKQFKSTGDNLTVWQKIDKLKTEGKFKTTDELIQYQKAIGYTRLVGKLRQDQKDAQAEINKLLLEQGKIESNLNTNTKTEETKQANEDAKKATKDNLQATLDAIEKRKKNELGALHAVVMSTVEGTKERLDAEIAYREKVREWDLKTVGKIETDPEDSKKRRIVFEKKTAGELKDINATADSDLLKLHEEFNKKDLESRVKLLDDQAEQLKNSNDEGAILVEANMQLSIDAFRKEVESAKISVDTKIGILDKLKAYEEKIAIDRDKRAGDEVKRIEDEVKTKIKAGKLSTSESGTTLTVGEGAGISKFISDEKKKIQAMNITAKAKEDLIEKLGTLETKVNEQVTEDAKKEEEKKAKAKAAAISAGKDFIGAASDFVKATYEAESEKYSIEKDKELTALQKQKDAGVITEKQYNTNKTKIENDFAIKQAQTKRKMAVMDKSIQLASIATNTALAVMNIWATVPKMDFGITTAILTGVAIATGALQAAAVMAQPLPEIPKFKHGTKNAPGGLSIVGDGGERELIKLPNGSTYWSSNTPQLVNLPKYSQVIPEHKIIQELSLRNSQITSSKTDSIDYDKVGKSIAKYMPENGNVFVNVFNQDQRITQRYRR